MAKSLLSQFIEPDPDPATLEPVIMTLPTTELHEAVEAGLEAVDEGFKAIATLERIQKVAEKSVDGLDEVGVEIANISIESICEKLGIRPKQSVMVSLEHFRDPSTRLVATRLSQESIGELIVQGLRKVIALLEAIWAKIKAVIKGIWSTAEDKRAEQLERAIKESVKEVKQDRKRQERPPKVSETRDSNIINCFTLDEEIPTKENYGILLQNYRDYLKKLTVVAGAYEESLFKIGKSLMSFADVMHEILYQDADITTILEADREAREKAGETFVERVKQNFEEAKKGKTPKIEPITGSTIEAIYCSPTLAFGKRIAMVQSINDADGIRRISATMLSRDTDVKENVGVVLLGEDEIVTMAKGHRELSEIRRNFQNKVYGQCETQIDMILSKMKKVAQHIESSQKQDETKATLQGIASVMGQTVESVLKDFNNIFTVSDLSAQSFMKVSDNYLRISEKRLKQNPEAA